MERSGHHTLINCYSQTTHAFQESTLLSTSKQPHSSSQLSPTAPALTCISRWRTSGASTGSNWPCSSSPSRTADTCTAEAAAEPFLKQLLLVLLEVLELAPEKWTQVSSP